MTFILSKFDILFFYVYNKRMKNELIQKLLIVTDEEQEIINSGKVDINQYTKRKSKKISGATYFEDGNEVFLRRHPRFANFPEHGHDYTEIMIVIAGNITHKIEDDLITLSAGDVLILNKFARHSICSTDKNDLGLNILLSDKFLLSFIQKTDVEILKGFFEENFVFAGEADYMFFKSASAIQTDNLIENLVCFTLSSGSTKNRAQSLTISLLLEQLPFNCQKIILHRKTDFLRGKYKISKEERYKNFIEKYIEEEFVDGSLSACARKMGINEQYLSRLTKSIFGKTFKRLLIDKRMEESEKLLLSDTLTVQETAAAIGYENVYGFNTAFKNKYGDYPSVWRDKQKKAVGGEN